MNVKLLAKSSGGEPYDVHFTIKGDLLKVFCECQAGIFGQICKHKIELLKGNSKMLYNLDQSAQLEEIAERVNKSSFYDHLAEYEENLSEIDKEFKPVITKIKKEMSEKKKNTRDGFAKLLKDGFK